jgi:hypothetical protein
MHVRPPITKSKSEKTRLSTPLQITQLTKTSAGGGRGQYSLYFAHTSTANFVQAYALPPQVRQTVIGLAIYLNDSQAMSLGFCGGAC